MSESGQDEKEMILYIMLGVEVERGGRNEARE